MSEQHTPGPWTFDNEIEFICTDASLHGEWYGDWAVARVNIIRAEAKANARLIAAAPDLLEALRELLAACKDASFASDPFDAVPNARAAIAKATTE